MNAVKFRFDGVPLNPEDTAADVSSTLDISSSISELSLQACLLCNLKAAQQGLCWNVFCTFCRTFILNSY